MKNRIAKFIFIIALLLLVFWLVACAGDSIKGTYYEYNDGVKNENNYVTLGKDSWTDSDGESGRLEVKDGVVYCYYNFFGSEEVLLFGTVSDGIFKFTFGDKMPSGELIYSNRYSDKSNAEYKDSRNYFGNSNPSNPSEPNNPTDPQPPQKATYTVSFDSCGGTSVAAKTVEEGAKLTAPNQPTRTMFVFAGWYKDSGYNKVWDFATDTVEENITLYARWTAEEVRVTSVNGAEINGTDIFMIVSNSVDEVDLTDKVILNSNTATWKLYYDKLGQMEIPTKLAATQSGSFKDGSNLFYIVVTSADATQSKTYTLDVYKKYEVTVKVIGREQQVLSTYGVMTLETLREPPVSPNYITGYTITGYSSTGTSVGAKVSKNSAKIITLTARLSANTYTATLNTDGGTIANSIKTVTYNSRASLGVPTRTGYSFDGWYLGSTQIAGSDGVCAAWTYAEDKTLRAKWTPNRYRITVEAAPAETGTGGSVIATGVDGSGSSVLGEYGSTVALTATTNNGFTFIGWYKGETKVSSERIYNAPVSVETVNYTAKWIKCPVTLEKNIAEAGTVSGVEGATAVGTETTIVATKNAGYIWQGWYTGKQLVSTELTYSFEMTEQQIVFTATYEKCINHITDDKCICTICEGESHVLDDKCFCNKCKKTAHIGFVTKGYCRHNENGTDHIYFGSYPQTVKAESVTVNDSADMDGYYVGSDGEKYKKAKAETSHKLSNGQALKYGDYYYFKVEPIRWRILREENGYAFLLCNKIIESSVGAYYRDNYEYPYYDDTTAPLKGIYRDAFTDKQKELMIRNVNSLPSYYSYNDFVRNLTNNEERNTSYGFSSDMSSMGGSDDARKMESSDYSLLRLFKPNYWRLDSASRAETVYKLNYFWKVDPDGFVQQYSGTLSDVKRYYGIAPVIEICTK